MSNDMTPSRWRYPLAIVPSLLPCVNPFYNDSAGKSTKTAKVTFCDDLKSKDHPKNPSKYWASGQKK
jgi:hypothetical protein